MGKCRSYLWNAFDVSKQNENRVTCRICEESFYYQAIFDLELHLKRNHNDHLKQLLDEEAADEGKGGTQRRGSRGRSRHNPVWEHYHNVDKTKRIAQCNVCSKVVSFKSTTNNLKSHLRHIHVTSFEELQQQIAEQEDEGRQEDSSEQVEEVVEELVDHDPTSAPRVYKKFTGPVWRYFDNVDNVRCIAECTLCAKQFSYYSTTGNLISHLRLKHDKAYHMMLLEKNGELTDAIWNPDHDQKGRVDINLQNSKNQVLWNFFERDGRFVRCVVCRMVLPNKERQLLTHLQEKHPKLVTDAPSYDQDESDAEDEVEQASNNGGDYDSGDANEPDEKEDVYTEVVYLEDNVDDTEARYSKLINNPLQMMVKDKGKGKKHATEFVSKMKNVKKRRYNSVSSDDRPPVMILKQEKSRVHANTSDACDSDDIENFGKYVMSLLRTVPRQLATKLQMDMINLVMNAKLEYEADRKKEKAVGGTPRTIIINSVEDINSQVSNVQQVGYNTVPDLSSSIIESEIVLDNMAPAIDNPSSPGMTSAPVHNVMHEAVYSTAKHEAVYSTAKHKAVNDNVRPHTENEFLVTKSVPDKDPSGQGPGHRYSFTVSRKRSDAMASQRETTSTVTS